MPLSSGDLALARELFDRSGEPTEAGRHRFDATEAEIDARWRRTRRRVGRQAAAWLVAGLVVLAVFTWVDIPWESRRVEVVAWVATVVVPLMLLVQLARARRATVVRDTARAELGEHRDELRRAAMLDRRAYDTALARARRGELPGRAAKRLIGSLRRR